MIEVHRELGVPARNKISLDPQFACRIAPNHVIAWDHDRAQQLRAIWPGHYHFSLWNLHSFAL